MATLLSLPPSLISRIASFLDDSSSVSSSLIHFVCASKQLFHSATISSESFSAAQKQSIKSLLRRLCRVECSVCGEPFFDSEAVSEEAVNSRLQSVISLALPHPTRLIESLPPNPNISIWHCPNKQKGCMQVYCSRLCGSPSSALLSCETEDECTDVNDAHGCIACFTELCDVMEGDAGIFECQKGLGDDLDDEDDEDLDDDDLFGDPAALDENEDAGMGRVDAKVNRGSSSDGESNETKRIGFMDVAGRSSVLKPTSTQSSRKRRTLDEERWWSAAAKRCRERGSVKDECICGECDLFEAEEEQKEDDEEDDDDEASK
ncbi:hypothetical protein BCR33DRAFT_719088 [Rhizoclosmatium globosum]|uniref:Uncharacterized protein n=1 Tax=Rhizoclosmatium globosum TaxID=329046 RepID=A0A1Y2C270_9FUNG|nr:hypothetical protein BCR33DRAFT_719088 [Rhizoclosmatium globosum]|eukprot:ORY40984.1 hypothetical protein BCR33DRAFT_719088 [Rhizoclosmatium globosum]